MKNQIIAFVCGAAVVAGGYTLTSRRGQLSVGEGGAQPYHAPRTPDGLPDLQGIWQAMNTAVWDLEDHSAQLGVPAGQGVVVGGEIPYLPSALPKRQENDSNRLTEDPEAKCFMVGTPRINYMDIHLFYHPIDPVNGPGKCEPLLKPGDMCGGLAVIADIPKMLCYRLAHYINRDREIIPQRVITRPPTA